MQKIGFVIGLVAGLCLFAACNRSAPDSRETTSTPDVHQEIVGGLQAGYPAVVKLDLFMYFTKGQLISLPGGHFKMANANGWYYITSCSSTAITSNQLLTATHCIRRYLDGGGNPVQSQLAGIIAAINPEQCSILNTNFIADGQPIRYPIGQVSGLAAMTGLTPNDGIAILNFPSGSFQSTFLITNTAPSVGSLYNLIGYSANPNAPGPLQNPQCEQWSGGSVLSSVSDAQDTFSPIAGTQVSTSVLVDSGDSGGPMTQSQLQQGVCSTGNEAYTKEGTSYAWAAGSFSTYMDLCAPEARAFINANTNLNLSDCQNPEPTPTPSPSPTPSPNPPPTPSPSPTPSPNPPPTPSPSPMPSPNPPPTPSPSPMPSPNPTPTATMD